MPVPGEPLEPDSFASVTHYDVGAHRVTIGRRGNWWFVGLDGVLLQGKFPTEASAWAAGVRRADEIDRG